MYVCVHMWLHVCVFICIHTCIEIYIYIYIVFSLLGCRLVHLASLQSVRPVRRASLTNRWQVEPGHWWQQVALSHARISNLGLVIHWIGLRENLPESPRFHAKTHGFPVRICPETNPMRNGIQGDFMGLRKTKLTQDSWDLSRDSWD